jgi:hypothetical protein
MAEDAAARLGRLVRARRKALKLTQADIQASGGPSTATLRLIENGKHTDFRTSTSQPLERALLWQPGSIASILRGGEPGVIPEGDGVPPWLQEQMTRMPVLPRNAPNAPVLSEIMKALGENPGAPRVSLPLSSADRKTLTNLRNKLFHSFGTAGSQLTEDETAVLTRFIEDDELRTLHVRIDWLPRAEQLEVSSFVNELQLRLEQRWVADGYSNESEQLPEYAKPNPLPVEGVAPNPADFPSEVPRYVAQPHRGDPSNERVHHLARPIEHSDARGPVPTPNGAPPDRGLAAAARTAPPGYILGQAEQGDPGGEENQDEGGASESDA